ncbi:hypothetical protein CR164_07460 [Prosthecochloris marina]|uniref:Radical SAM core domain-containing protein n=1 Tax=Prosthecochloris marina TaxID=2017681 RepID=A0A317T9P3_9CHLB|nr:MULTISPECIES: radical SAM protein [Prosthecochloris]PWW82161.1 hypothetical protein CR164_07460 [Prosthecochloris marina]UZJ39782.1 radical SAM protein [Prosthecochloris sp. SCSIO W1102]
MIERESVQVYVNGRPVLRRVQIEPTNRCNFTCGYCRRTHWARPEGDMRLERFREVLDRLPEVSHIHLQGVGEPLLNKDLPAMIRCSRLCGARVGTTTNASLLSMKKAMALLDSGINRINLSVDTLEATDFSRLRPGLSIKKVLANITELAELRYNGGYEDISLAFALVTVQPAIESLSSIIRLAAELGLDEVYLQNLNGSFLPAGYLDEESPGDNGYGYYREATQSAHALASRLGIRFLPPAMDIPDYSWRCRWPLHGCNVTWDGFVSPCCLQPDPDVLHFGNLFETDFEKIWSSPAYHHFRARVQADCEPLCAGCPDRYGQMWHPTANPFAELQP